MGHTNDRKARRARWMPDGKSSDDLRMEYLALLDGSHPEQIYQDFIEKNTRLVPREFIQNHGIHLHLVLTKLAFGADYKSDLVYLSKSSDDWHCVLVELERPNSRFFKNKSNGLHADFVRSLEQIDKWRAWISNTANKSGFVDGMLRTIRTPLSENPTYIKYVLVLERREEYSGNHHRRQIIASHERSDFKIITYDSLAEDLEMKHNLYVGSRKNEYIDIVSDSFLSGGNFRVGPTRAAPCQ